MSWLANIVYWLLVFVVPAVLVLVTYPVVRAVMRESRRFGTLLETGTPWYDDVLRTVADEVGLTFRARRFLLPPAAVGQLDGFPVRVQLEAVEAGHQEVLEVRLTVARLPREVRFFRRSNPVSSRGRRSGDALFDEGVVFEAPHTDGRSWLRVQTRLAVQDVVQAGGELRGGLLLLTHSGTDLMGAAEVTRLLRQAMRVARDLREGPVDLRTIAETDPEPEARLWALDQLSAELELDRGWLSALAGTRDDRVAVRAASMAGDEARLRELLAGPAAREALLALWSVLTPADDVDSLVCRLIRERPTVELLQLAARCCTVASVVELLAVSGPHRAAARDAVAAIQSRALGERGGLAVAEGALDAGRLALAESTGGGGLSEAAASTSRPGRARVGGQEGT